jgi:ribosomal protein L12E/L44/L45/RPP1/RPP2
MTTKTTSKATQAAAASKPAEGDFLSPFNRALAEKLRPVMARVQELLPDIEIALANGYTHVQIADALKAENIEITPVMLTTYIHRLRKRRQIEQLIADDRAKASAPTDPQSTDETPGIKPSDPQAQGGQK